MASASTLGFPPSTSSVYWGTKDGIPAAGKTVKDALDGVNDVCGLELDPYTPEDDVDFVRGIRDGATTPLRISIGESL